MTVIEHQARRWLIAGRVQGVGFRPFVFRLAQQYRLRGRVQNLAGQVSIEAEGEGEALDAFERALLNEAPPLAKPELVTSEAISPLGLHDFEIVASAASSEPNIHVPPDYFLCEDCRRELLDPRDRRYRYPFINCTQCGPRYTLITRLPYDRPHTTMAGFPLCDACSAEYENPGDRRFHAEPVACAACGPRLSYVEGNRRVEGNEPALAACIAAIRAGKIVAAKGVGGYHLLCDARSETAVARLRERKARPHKPLALMFSWQGADGCDAVREEALLDDVSACLLGEPARAVVLVPRRDDSRLAPSIAPGLREIGVMLPYSPLHHLLLADFGGPLVATSANISGEPVLTDNDEVEARLARVADACLHHDRPIARPADDSVLRMVGGQPRLIRAGRGLAPIELDLPFRFAQPTLAVGGHMKNTVALGWNDRVVVSPHIGDLDAPRSLAVFEQIVGDLQGLYGVRAERLVCDAHPGYASSRWAARQGLPVLPVWHHHAHASALVGEQCDARTWLTFTWDGVGLGVDGSLWGGEALLGRPGAWQRVMRLRPFRLPGGERAGRQPWRAAAALCWEAGREWDAPGKDTVLLHHAWERGLNAPATSAAGRLFDAAASLLGLIADASFEGQGPMYLEAIAAGDIAPLDLPVAQCDGLWRLDWSPLLDAMRDATIAIPLRAMLFHRTLAHAIARVAAAVRTQHRFDIVGLAGGVFQNKLLSELALDELAAVGLEAFLPQRLPCNDGAIAFGQLIDIGMQNG